MMTGPIIKGSGLLEGWFMSDMWHWAGDRSSGVAHQRRSYMHVAFLLYIWSYSSQ
jgi:hypothetical protein